MADDDVDETPEPLVQPRLVRLLKERPRLIDLGFRREMLEEMDEIISERRRPDKVAQRTVGTTVDNVKNSTQPVLERRAVKRMEKANEKLLNRL